MLEVNRLLNLVGLQACNATAHEFHCEGEDGVNQTILRGRRYIWLHRLVRRDAAAAIHYATSVRVAFSPGRSLRAVARFRMKRAALRVIVIKTFVRVVALNQATRRRVILRNRQQQSRAVFELKWILHKSFTETGLANYQSAVVILKRARQDFRCRGRAAIDQHDERRLVWRIINRRKTLR